LSATAGYALNLTRQAYLCTRLSTALTHWTRLRGLIGTARHDFTTGSGLWIAPCHGVHTFAMSFPIDVLYLDSQDEVIHLEANLKPWRFAPVLSRAKSVLELPTGCISATGTACGDKIKIVANGAAEVAV
jgi:uncharacterized membrane protein (UPF0127 family)